VLHQIGVGALGPVFRTYEPTRDRLVAVKVFRLDITPEQAAALAEELGRATEAGLIHPSIVEPVAAGLEGTVAYRAEEYVAAESLDVAMRHYAPAALDKALPFIAQLASAIDTARAAGVGHGALHPRDIFVTPDEARATGFGVVDALDRLGLRAPVRRPYSPPERIAGKTWSTPADVFSLGAIAFELLTGRRPSGLGDQMGSLNGAALGSHGDAIRAVLAKAMDEDPGARYPTAGAFASALAAASDQATASAVVVAAPQVVETPPIVETSIVDPLHVTIDAAELSGDEAESLNIFASEPESTLADSPREAARRAIAARKRNPKPKPLTEAKPPAFDLDPAPAAPIEEAAPSAPDARPEPAIAASTSTAPIDVPVVALDESLPDIESTSQPLEADAGPRPAAAKRPAEPAQDEPLRLPASRSRQDAPEHVDAATGFPVATLADVDLWHLDPITAKAPEVAGSDVVAEMPSLAVALPGDAEPKVDAPLAADSSDRIVAVDEFRAREASNPRPERTWPRPSARPMPSIAPVSRGVPPPTKLLETNDIPLVPEDEVSEREPPTQRFAMMPYAIILILGLLLGYPFGYFVARRESQSEIAKLAAAQSAAPAPSSFSTPGTASTPGTTGNSRAYSDQVVSPGSGQGASGPLKPVDGTARVAPPAATAVTPPPAASTATPPVTPTRTEPTSSKPAPSRPERPKPAAAAPAAATPAPASGRIVVMSSPAKAAVTVNGKWTGRTPLTLDKREFGEYTIRVVEPGYDVAREVFTLSAKAPAKTIDVTLKPLASAGRRSTAAAPPAPSAQKPAEKAGTTATGTLFVDSRPQGAKVMVNGKPAGVTPLRLNEQPVGSYEVRLELADHQPWTATTRVVGGETARVTGSLERIR
jgi:serine/threonine protein kinase